jgi:transposase
MPARSSLTAAQRQSAVVLFDLGMGRDAVATHLGLGRGAVMRLYDRWRIWGGEVLVPKGTKRVFPFAVKLEIVQRFLAGETKMELAQEFALSSPQLIEKWAQIYRAEGDDGLRPKPKGRPKRDPTLPAREESEVEQLRRENLRLRAEIAYLGKLRTLIAAERQ